MITDVIDDKTQQKKIIPRAILLGGIILVLFAASLTFLFLPRGRDSSPLTARVYQDGVLIKQIDLKAVTEPYSFPIACPSGGSNTVTVRPGAIGISEADCPDKLCVSTGYIDSSLLPIVCLPHNLIIEITARDNMGDPDSAGVQEPDAISY